MNRASRQRWLRILAMAEPSALASLADPQLASRRFEWLRLPQTGLVTVEGRIGGSGDRFHLAEVVATRCVVRHRLDSGGRTAGVGYVFGRRADHAARVAKLDALLQDPTLGARLEDCIVATLERQAAQRREIEARRSEASRVDFYTLASEGTPG